VFGVEIVRVRYAHPGFGMVVLIIHQRERLFIVGKPILNPMAYVLQITLLLFHRVLIIYTIIGFVHKERS
jgi:hypothetical protein